MFCLLLTLTLKTRLIAAVRNLLTVVFNYVLFCYDCNHNITASSYDGYRHWTVKNEKKYVIASLWSNNKSAILYHNKGLSVLNSYKEYNLMIMKCCILSISHSS